jgi:hypothetical protein
MSETGKKLAYSMLLRQLQMVVSWFKKCFGQFPGREKRGEESFVKCQKCFGQFPGREEIDEECFAKFQKCFGHVSDMCQKVSIMSRSSFDQFQTCFRNVSDLLGDIFKLCEQLQKCFSPVRAAIGAHSVHTADSSCETVQNVHYLPKCLVNVSDSFSM